MTRKPYQLTLADLRQYCTLLAKIEVIGGDTKAEQLVGRNAAGEVVVRSKPGKVTPARVTEFRDAYQRAVTEGIIKRFTPAGQERT